MKQSITSDASDIHRCFNPTKTGQIIQIYAYSCLIYISVLGAVVFTFGLKGVMVRQMQENKKRRLVIAERCPTSQLKIAT